MTLARTRDPAHVRSRAIALVILAVVTPELSAQPTRLSDQVSCEGCTITVSDTVTLTAVESTAIPSTLATAVVRDPSNGRFYALYSGVLDHIFAFDSSGQSLGTVGGRFGSDESPGFVSRIQVSQSGHLRAFDRRRGLIVDVDTRTGVQTASRSFPHVAETWTIAQFNDGTLVLGGPVASADAAGYPLHVFSATHTWVRSFGVSEPVLRPDLRSLLSRFVATADATAFWAMPVNEYRLQRWSREGTLQVDVRAERLWFEPWVRRVIRSPAVPPAASTVDLTVDDDGSPWVMIGVPAANWDQALDTLRDAMGNLALKPGVTYRDVVVEVLTPSAESVIARTRLEGGWSGFAAPGWIWRSRWDLQGRAHVEVARIGTAGRQ